MLPLFADPRPEVGQVEGVEIERRVAQSGFGRVEGGFGFSVVELHPGAIRTVEVPAQVRAEFAQGPADRVRAGVEAGDFVATGGIDMEMRAALEAVETQALVSAGVEDAQGGSAIAVLGAVLDG